MGYLFLHTLLHTGNWVWEKSHENETALHRYIHWTRVTAGVKPKCAFSTGDFLRSRIDKKRYDRGQVEPDCRSLNSSKWFSGSLIFMSVSGLRVSEILLL